MRRLLLLALSASFVLLGGCTTTRQRSTASAGGSLPPEPFVGSPTGGGKDSPAAPLVNRSLGEFAGQVLEPSRRRVANASIQVIPADESGTPRAKFTVKSDSEGYFNIPALEKGRRYQLVARSKRGEQVWTGRTFATASDVRIAIWLTEIRPAVAETTPARGMETTPLPPIAPPGAATPSADRIAADKEKRDFDLGAPPPVVSIPGSTARDRGDDPIRKPSMPPAPIRSEGGVTTPLPGARPAPTTPAPADEAPLSTGKAEVPSCVRTGFVVHNFALKDFDGQDWELTKRCKGKYVLVDFWSLSCPPCIQSIPKLVGLQRRWGGKGVQVVGVLCGEGDLDRRKKGVLAAAARMHTRFNYPIVFSEGRDCPVRRKMEVFAYPTLRLLDPRGRIIWESQGFDERTAASLEYELQRRLGP